MASDKLRRSKPSHGLTTDEIALASVLHMINWQSGRFADAIDPEHKCKDPLATHLDGIARLARAAFFELTGRPIHNVQSAHLSTEEPAAWLELPREARENPHSTWWSDPKEVGRAKKEAK